MSTTVLENYLSEQFPGVVFKSSVGASIIHIEWELEEYSKATKVSVQQTILNLVKAGMNIPIDNVMFSITYSESRVLKAKNAVLQEFSDAFYDNKNFYNKSDNTPHTEANFRYKWLLDNYEFNKVKLPDISELGGNKITQNTEEIKDNTLRYIWSQLMWAASVYEILGISKINLFNQILVMSMMDAAGQLDNNKKLV